MDCIRKLSRTSSLDHAHTILKALIAPLSAAPYSQISRLRLSAFESLQSLQPGVSITDSQRSGVWDSYLLLFCIFCDDGRCAQNWEEGG